MLDNAQNHYTQGTVRITKIERQKRRPNRISIYVDEKFTLGLNEDVFFSFSLSKGMEIEQSLLDELVRAEKKQKTKEQAFRLLSYRQRSERELKDRLKQKGTESCVVDGVVKELEKFGLVNDVEFAETWVRERGKRYGPIRLRSELFRKGISEEIIEQTLTDFNEGELAGKLVEQWTRTHKNLTREVAKRRLFGFLAGRGISYETIRSLEVFGG